MSSSSASKPALLPKGTVTILHSVLVATYLVRPKPKASATTRPSLEAVELDPTGTVHMAYTRT